MATAKQKRILIGEDEKPLARALALKLEGAGFEVVVVHDGDAAKEEAATGTFDLIFLDLMMPKSDGFSVLHDMHTKKIETPVVVISNLSQATDKDKVKEAGALQFFVKGDTSLAELVAFAQQQLNQ